MKVDRKRRAEARHELVDAVDSLIEASKDFEAAGCVQESKRASRLVLDVLDLMRGAAERPS